MKCRQCTVKFEKENAVYQGAYYFCSKKCRLDFTREKARKQKEKEKVKKQKAREKKSNSVSVLKKKLWTIVSEYIRLRDSDDENFCTCCTCGIYKHYKDNIHAGHYVASGQSSFHRYNEKNIHAQCGLCNVGKNGCVLEYREFMINKYGLEYTEWLYESRNTTIDLWSVELKELIEQYQVKLYEIKNNKAIT